MSEYKTLKAEYKNLKLRLVELNTLAERARHAWYKTGTDDKKERKETDEAEKNSRDMSKRVKALAYKLAVLEHKELGTSLNKLFKEYGITTVTIKKLLKEHRVAYLRPTMVQWLPIGTAPWLEPIIATWKNSEGTPVVCMLCKHVIHTGVDSPLSETLNLERLVHYWSIDMGGEEQLEVNPTHWMPMPKPPVFEEGKNEQ